MIERTSLEKNLDRYVYSYKLNINKMNGIILVLCIIFAVLIASSKSFTNNYEYVLNLNLFFGFDNNYFSIKLKDFVNNFLIVIFFFVLGLEMKKEMIIGDLSNIRSSLVVFSGALGGVLVPIIIFSIINFNDSTFIKGWSIPIGTDTAIAIGLMSIFDGSFPKRTFKFLACLSILDDLIGIGIITFVYSSNSDVNYLLISLIVITILIASNLSGLINPFVYFIGGLALCILFEHAGIHSTVAGIITALTVPSRPKVEPGVAISKIRNLIMNFEKEYKPHHNLLGKDSLNKIIAEVSDESKKVTTPVNRWEDKIKLPIFFIILPIFILINGGIKVNNSLIFDAAQSSLFWGVFFALTLGKPLGVFLFTEIFVWLKKYKRPFNINKKELILVGIVSGFAFTFTSFVANLTYSDTYLLDIIKLSAICALIGSVIILVLNIKIFNYLDSY